MSLRVKVEFALFIVLASLVGVSYGIQRWAVFPNIEMLEGKMANEALDVGIEGIEDRIERLEARCVSWSQSRSTMENLLALEGAGAAFGRDYLERNFLTLIQVHYPGQPPFTVAYDTAEGQTLGDFSLPVDRLITDTAPRSGIVMTAAGPMLIASAPVANDPQNPHLILGRLLNRKLLDEIYFESNVVMHVWPAEQPDLPLEVRRALNDMRREGAPRNTSRNDNLASVYTYYPDVFGSLSLIFRADISHAVVGQAYDTMQRGLMVQIGVGVLAFSLLVVLFRGAVMNPLKRLTAHTVQIRQTNDLTRRLNMDRTDEIGVLGREFDGMVEHLDRDIRAREDAERALRESEQRYSLAAEGANDGIWDWRLDEGIIHYSERWKNLLDYKGEEISNRPEEWFDRVHEDDKENLQTVLDAHLNGQSNHFESEHRLYNKNRQVRWMLFRGLAQRDEAGKVTRMCGSMADVTVRKEYEEQLKHQSLHDALTDLPNRALLIDRLQQSIMRARRDTEYRFALVFLDLDRFKVVNDGLGHVIGDKLLTEIAKKLALCIREGDTVTRAQSSTLARFGGDEFVLLLENLAHTSGAVRVAERIQLMLQDPFYIDGNEIYSSASIGIVLSDGGLTSPEDIIRNADTAMYRAKANGTNRYEMFDEEMHADAIRRLELENDLRKAIENEDLEVFYQPIVCLKTAQIKAFEALVRWKHPERGHISPEEFVPIAEETGLIVPLGQYVMRTACAQVNEWQNAFPRYSDLSISVNLSPREFGNAQLVATIEDNLIRANLDSRFLKIEITESSLMESVDVISRTLEQIRRLGAQLSIDDFGTGYSSLSQLHRFPMNNLKIDQAFVREMHESRESMQIIKTITLLAHALNMAIVAEGIEEESHIPILQEMDCQFGQGFFFSKAVDAEAATQLLADEHPEWASAIGVTGS